jgi:Ca2+-binding RTX toxin-like protein
MTTQYGTSGNDTFGVTNPGDIIIESPNGGIDSIQMYNTIFSYTIPDNVENLLQFTFDQKYLESTISGNQLNNQIELVGYSSNVTVHGGDGNDFIRSTGSGQNVLYGEKGNDFILTFADDSIYGGSGNDTLWGGALAAGGSGDDIYSGFFINSNPANFVPLGDSILELPGEGFDEIYVNSDFVSPDNIESISLGYSSQLANTVYTPGTGNFNLTANNQGMYMYGNAGNNVLTGGTGNDTITSGLGTDTLAGGAGDDTYDLRDVGDQADTIIEQANGGRDSVWTYVDNATLADNVEVLYMAGSNALQGNGSAGNNAIFGNARNNTIDGKAGNDGLYDGPGGNDTLHGGAGTDRLFIESGNDVIQFGVGDGYDVIRSFDQTGYDLLKIDGVDESQIWFSMSGTDLNIDLIGRNDGITVSLWTAGKDFQIDAIQLQNGHILSADKIAPLVSAMSTFTPPAAGQTTLSADYQRDLGTAITQAWG